MRKVVVIIATKVMIALAVIAFTTVFVPALGTTALADDEGSEEEASGFGDDSSSDDGGSSEDSGSSDPEPSAPAEDASNDPAPSPEPAPDPTPSVGSEVSYDVPATTSDDTSSNSSSGTSSTPELVAFHTEPVVATPEVVVETVVEAAPAAQQAVIPAAVEEVSTTYSLTEAYEPPYATRVAYNPPYYTEVEDLPDVDEGDSQEDPDTKKSPFLGGVIAAVLTALAGLLLLLGDFRKYTLVRVYGKSQKEEDLGTTRGVKRAVRKALEYENKRSDVRLEVKRASSQEEAEQAGVEEGDLIPVFLKLAARLGGADVITAYATDKETSKINEVLNVGCEEETGAAEAEAAA